MPNTHLICVLTFDWNFGSRYWFQISISATFYVFFYLCCCLCNYFSIPEEEKEKISIPLLRLQFIFLQKEKFLTRAKRAIRNQPEPMLLSSYRGHLKAITSVVYINLAKVVIR